MKKLIATVALVASLAGVSVLATAPPASAGAYGCNTWGAGSFNGYPYAKGYYCAEINGSGTYVKYVGGGFQASANNVCNWNITAEFFDASGRWYQTINGPMHYRCEQPSQ